MSERLELLRSVVDGAGVKTNPELPLASKACPRCGVHKPVDSFGTHGTNETGVQSWCLECSAEYSRVYGLGQAKGRRDALGRLHQEERDAIETAVLERLEPALVEAVKAAVRALPGYRIAKAEADPETVRKAAAYDRMMAAVGKGGGM